MAFLIVIILSEDFTAFHASKMTLFLHQRSIALQTYLFLFVIKGTGMIWINIHDLAVNTVPFFTILTIFWAFLLSFAELTARNRILRVDIDQGMSARTLSINVSDDLLRSRLIKVLRQVGIASLAYTKIAMMIIIDSIIADSRANATNITYVIEIRYPLEIKLMANRTSFFGTRRDSTINAVIFLADPAKRTAQFHLLALTARQVDHFLIGTNKELQLMVVEAFIFFFHFFDMQLLRRHELTLFIMFLEMFDRGKFGRAQASIIWTVELELELGHWGNQEG